VGVARGDLCGALYRKGDPVEVWVEEVEEEEEEEEEAAAMGGR